MREFSVGKPLRFIHEQMLHTVFSNISFQSVSELYGKLIQEVVGGVLKSSAWKELEFRINMLLVFLYFFMFYSFFFFFCKKERKRNLFRASNSG